MDTVRDYYIERMFVEIGKGGDVPLARIILKSHEDCFAYICNKITNDQLEFISDYSIINKRLKNPQKYMKVILDNIHSITENGNEFIQRVFDIERSNNMYDELDDSITVDSIIVSILKKNEKLLPNIGLLIVSIQNGNIKDDLQSLEAKEKIILEEIACVYHNN